MRSSFLKACFERVCSISRLFCFAMCSAFARISSRRGSTKRG